MTTSTPFLSDVQELRRRARENMMRGPVTDDYRGDVKQSVDILNAALATELVCVLRYKRHFYMCRGIYKDAVADEFAEHARQEQEHADMIAERITQLGGEPDFNPEGMASRSHSEYREGESMLDMIKENLVAERVAIESYREMIRFFGDNDPTTRRMLEQILAVEEEHANDMVDLLEQHGTAVRGEA
ncbi:MAG TPA: ferritin-like domain-containing protein [Candidatus Baltobacteraceae bacterium]